MINHPSPTKIPPLLNFIVGTTNSGRYTVVPRHSSHPNSPIWYRRIHYSELHVSSSLLSSGSSLYNTSDRDSQLSVHVQCHRYADSFVQFLFLINKQCEYLFSFRTVSRPCTVLWRHVGCCVCVRACVRARACVCVYQNVAMPCK